MIMVSTIISSITDALFSMEITTLSAVIKLVISFALGATIGIERQTRRQTAGMRTITLICMGSTAATMLSIWIPQSYPHFLNGDPGRIAAQIITGIGFLGAGAIMQSRGSVKGLTTAACIWVIAIVGMCVGAGMYIPALVLTFGTLFVLVALERIEKRRMISGDIKLLAIVYITDEPDIKRITNLLAERSVYIYNISVNKNFTQHSSQISFKIQVNPLETLDYIFTELKTDANIDSVSIREL